LSFDRDRISATDVSALGARISGDEGAEGLPHAIETQPQAMAPEARIFFSGKNPAEWMLVFTIVEKPLSASAGMSRALSEWNSAKTLRMGGCVYIWYALILRS
jgi:hypothetical protein